MARAHLSCSRVPEQGTSLAMNPGRRLDTTQMNLVFIPIIMVSGITTSYGMWIFSKDD